MKLQFEAFKVDKSLIKNTPIPVVRVEVMLVFVIINFESESLNSPFRIFVLFWKRQLLILTVLSYLASMIAYLRLLLSTTFSMMSPEANLI